MDSPIEGGFKFAAATDNPGQSVAMMKRHIKELYGRLSRAESDKQKIADEAFMRAATIKRECDERIEDARAAQGKQASLVERLKVRKRKRESRWWLMT
jgi:hypothetical protein